MNVVDTVSLISFLASPVLIAFISTQAEKWEWFQAIAPNGKLVAIAAVAVFLSWASLALGTFISGHPEVLAQVDPFVKTALIAVSFVASQVTHGARSAKGLN